MRFGFPALVICAAWLYGCKSDEHPPPAAPPYQSYPPAPAATPAPAPTAAPAPAVPAPTAAAPAPAAPGGLSTPSPMALPCTADANCLFHRCNTAAGKCAWPCTTDNDCNPGNGCMAGACVPKVQ